MVSSTSDFARAAGCVGVAVVLTQDPITDPMPALHLLGWLEVWHVYVSASVYGLLLMISLAWELLVTLLFRPALLAQPSTATITATETMRPFCRTLT